MKPALSRAVTSANLIVPTPVERPVPVFSPLVNVVCDAVPPVSPVARCCEPTMSLTATTSPAVLTLNFSVVLASMPRKKYRAPEPVDVSVMSESMPMNPAEPVWVMVERTCNPIWLPDEALYAAPEAPLES